MIDHIAAAAKAARAASASAATPAPAATRGSGFARELARHVDASQSSVKAVKRPDGEMTRRVEGHPYARIENGPAKGLYINQVPGSPRAGAVFRLVERDGHVFHVYGEGRDRVITGPKPVAGA